MTLADFRGAQSIVPFWHPGCSYCAWMLDDLKQWEATRAPEDLKLLVVSTGTVEDN